MTICLGKEDGKTLSKMKIKWNKLVNGKFKFNFEFKLEKNMKWNLPILIGILRYNFLILVLENKN